MQDSQINGKQNKQQKLNEFQVNIWIGDELSYKPTNLSLFTEKDPQNLSYLELRNIISETLGLDYENINLEETGNFDLPELYDWSVQKSKKISDLNKIKIIVNHKPIKPIIIGITGPTRCGKGTLANYLKVSLNAEIMNMDSFYYSEQYIDEKLNGNWETPDSYNWNQLFIGIGEKINYCIQKQKPYLIIDSFLLFEKKDIFDLCDYRIFMEIQDEEIKSRRENYIENQENYVENFVLPYYKQYREKVIKNYDKNDIIFIDGMRSKLDIFQQVKKIIKKR
ncbi:P-loop containing nucleoside triphosphate hydrolase [Pseudocohnilembus persalinus]|uniref:p-loop containing nucleoside triphosphate hydrolase n=1 Tax=Pseudocohnilembus persalinus TaxID=266149 RepID=A0A0V0QI22_PSEPJ|nr:P-loop containing nucleoside triphosphate hydrolase [Pseudocohnilembus persalinus]|eukprot:KRX01696.1 P-loop containing nucleoside triphosphate hydrolase [Pseudocohnilembus persalinus]